MMANSAPKKNLAIAFWMIALGSLATRITPSPLQTKWAYRVLETKLCDLSMLISGIVLLASGAACLAFTGYQRAASAVGAVAASVFAAALFVGLFSGAIPCSGPI